MEPTSSAIGLMVIVALYISIGVMSAAGSVYLSKSMFSTKVEQIFFGSPSGDPNGYAEAKKHWTRQAARSDATAQILSHAARFLQPHDAPLAEELLLRAQARDPEAKTLRVSSTANRTTYWSRRIGTFYGQVLVGSTSPRDGAALRPLDADLFARRSE